MKKTALSLMVFAMLGTAFAGNNTDDKTKKSEQAVKKEALKKQMAESKNHEKVNREEKKLNALPKQEVKPTMSNIKIEKQ
jgi:Na+-translocating ferredoxin:NAD+ oxidoreductase RnfG subunit